MPPDVQLVLVFRSGSEHSLSKQQQKEDTIKAENEYSLLLDTLRNGGLHAVGRRGEKQGQLIVLVRCSDKQLAALVQREKHSDFLHGLNTSSLPSKPRELDPNLLSPADRLRLVHQYITATPGDGGLGISPESHRWHRLQSLMAVRDPEFNQVWLRSLTKRHVQHDQLDTIRSEFGEAVAFYFAFLVSYTHALIPISLLGIFYHFFGHPYSLFYSLTLSLWAITFTEWWRVRERMFSVRWGTLGSFRVEKRRAQFIQPIPWWKKELRMLVSIPVMVLFASMLFVLLTAMFVLEAFVTTLYTGPGHEYISFLPTILFIALVPRFMAFYQSYADRLTAWENHRHQSTFDSSITIKTFSLSAMVAYLGLALSAFVYVPFGEQIMSFVQMNFFHSLGRSASLASKAPGLNTTLTPEQNMSAASEKIASSPGHLHEMFETDVVEGKNRINRSRLQNQMFAYTVTDQVIGTFLEVGLPFIMRAVESLRDGKGVAASVGVGGTKRRSNSGSKKRVGFQEDGDNQHGGSANGSGNTTGSSSNLVGGREEREFLERVRTEVSLPDYGLFADYSELVTQFGYIVLWSTIWPLAPAMALVNNFIELRSDAFKIVTHFRRPLPTRADTIGPWLSCLSFLTWLSALTNSALVYLFRSPSNLNSASPEPLTTTMARDQTFTIADLASGTTTIEQLINGAFGSGSGGPTTVSGPARTRNLYLTAILIALAASHGWIVLRVLIRHLVERIVWKGSIEEQLVESGMEEVKERYLKSVGIGGVSVSEALNVSSGAVPPVVPPKDIGVVSTGTENKGATGVDPFWQSDEGLDEIRRNLKDA